PFLVDVYPMLTGRGVLDGDENDDAGSGRSDAGRARDLAAALWLESRNRYRGRPAIRRTGRGGRRSAPVLRGGRRSAPVLRDGAGSSDTAIGRGFAGAAGWSARRGSGGASASE